MCIDSIPSVICIRIIRIILILRRFHCLFVKGLPSLVELNNFII